MKFIIDDADLNRIKELYEVYPVVALDAEAFTRDFENRKRRRRTAIKDILKKEVIIGGGSEPDK